MKNWKGKLYVACLLSVLLILLWLLARPAFAEMRTYKKGEPAYTAEIVVLGYDDSTSKRVGMVTKNGIVYADNGDVLPLGKHTVGIEKRGYYKFGSIIIPTEGYDKEE